MTTTRETDRSQARESVRRGVRGLAQRAVRWGVPRAQALYAVVGLWLALAFALAALALWGFVELGDEVADGSTQAFDVGVLGWMDRNADPVLTELALSVTALGSALVIAVMALLVSAFQWIHGQKRALALLWLALLGAWFLNAPLKMFFARDRPSVFEWRTLGAGGDSFPSGHAMNAMVAYTVFAFLVARLQAGADLRWLTFAVAALVIALVGLSRMYLGVHYPTDVLAGFAAGFAWAMACVFAVYVLADLRAS